MPASPTGPGGREPHHQRPDTGRRGALRLLAYVPPAILTFSVTSRADNGSDPPPPPGGTPDPLLEEIQYFSSPKKKR